MNAAGFTAATVFTSPLDDARNASCASSCQMNDGTVEHTLDIYRPADAAGPLPMLQYVHGGAFQILSKETHVVMALSFARMGFVVALPNYRLPPAHRFPAPLEDAAASLRCFVDHASRFGGDVSQLVLAGESAGANLVTALVTGATYGRQDAQIPSVANIPVRAVLPARGVYEVGRAHRFAELFPDVHWFVDDRYRSLANYLPLQDGVPVDHPLASPLLLVENGAPSQKLPLFFLPVGGADHLKHDNARLAAALRGHGVSVEVREYPGEPHAFHAMVWKPNAKQMWRDTAAFLKAQGLPIRDVPPLPG